VASVEAQVVTTAAHPLRQRSIAALITAEVVSSLGSQMTFLALPCSSSRPRARRR
jgi:hypothetical protein